ncbi:unnamed protein product [Withania somnifera]
MNKHVFSPTHITLASVSSACAGLGELECGRVSHASALKYGLHKNVYVGNAFLSLYVKCGCPHDALIAFRELNEPNEVSFTAMMCGLFRLIQRTSIWIDSVSLSSVLRVCAKGRSSNFGETDDELPNTQGKQVHGLTIKLGFERELHVCNTLLDMYAKNGDITVSWNVMISGFGQNRDKERVMEYMERMWALGVEPDEVTYINMLAACGKSGDVENGHLIFESMACPSLISWNAILSGYSQNEEHLEALKLFREMQFQKQLPDQTTLAVILSCSEIGFLECGVQVHTTSLKLTQADIVCWNSLITGLSYNSLDKEAFTLFKQMLKMGMLPNEFSFATTLSCCTKLSSLLQGRQLHGLIIKDEDAIFLYEDMIYSGGKRVFITFIATLTACSHSGLVDLGLKIFNSMQQQYGLNPLVDHYTCIIGCLGRTARISEIELRDKMPCKDDSVVWEVLLSSCRLYGNLIRLDLQNSAPFVLLANMYTSLGRWDDTEEIRAAMLERQVKKDPGFM